MRNDLRILSLPLNRIVRATLIFLVLTYPAAAQTRKYVDANLTTGANNGTSWGDAFRGKLGLKAALDSVSGLEPVEVWVAQGEYTPSPPNVSPPVSFELKENVAVFGGFLGTETSLSQRDFENNLTVLQGDLNGSDDSTCMNFVNSALSHVVHANNLDATAILDGLVIRSGYPDLQPQSPCSAGMWIEGGSPTVRNCTFEGMSAGEGAGLLIIGSAPLVEDCTFRQNSAQIGGGGVAHGDGSAGTFLRCRFEENESGNGAGFYNGPLRASSSTPSSPMLEDCDFVENTGNFGAPIGGGLYSAGGSLTLNRCRFLNNFSTNGGGIHLVGGINSIRDCTFVGNLGSPDGAGAIGVDTGFTQITNCIMTGGEGGCGHALRAQSATVQLTNCTIAHNGFFPPPNGHAAVCAVGPGTMVILANTIVWNNADPFEKLVGAQLQSCCGAMIAAYSSAIQDLDASIPGVGSVGVDPMFAAPAGVDRILGTIDDDFRLSPSSPCIDAGLNSAVPVGVTTDIAGRLRRVDDPNTVDTGMGVAPIVDMGAFEFQICFADLNSDDAINLDDWSNMYDNFGVASGAEFSDGDFDNDEDVDMHDFVVFQIEFGVDCP